MEVASCVFLLLCLFIAPLLVFTPQIALAKRTGRLEYGTLAHHYVRDFDTKWLRGGAPAAEPFLGNPDIQSLADLGNSYAMVRAMRIVPVNKDTIIYLAAVTLAPIAPLVLTMIPLEVLLKNLLSILF
jgi:hypothetical protein